MTIVSTTAKKRCSSHHRGDGGGLVAKSCPTLAIPWIVPTRPPLSMGFSRQEYWSGLSFPSPEYLSISFRYDLNQIPYHCTVEVINSFKGFDLVDRVSEEVWMEINNIVQEVITKAIPRKRNARRQSGCLRKLSKYLRKEEKWKSRKKGKEILNWMQSSREQGEIRMTSLKNNARNRGKR